MIFVKFIRILAAALAIWLICHLLYSVGRKSATTRPSAKDDTGNARRKFVKSSVVEKESQTGKEGQS